MVDIVRLQNYKRSIGVHASTEGFEQEALGAMVGLTIYGILDHGTRIAWVTAAQKAAIGPQAGALAQSYFYSSLLQAKARAFGFSIDVNWADYNYAQCPWGLPDEMFQAVYEDLKQGKGKAQVAPVTFGSLMDKAKDFASEHSKLAAGYLAASTFGGAVLGKAKQMVFDFVKKYIPEAAAMIPESLGAMMSEGTLIGTAGVLAYDAEVPGINRADLAAYDTDNERRLYDNTVYFAGR